MEKETEDEKRTNDRRRRRLIRKIDRDVAKRMQIEIPEIDPSMIGSKIASKVENEEALRDSKKETDEGKEPLLLDEDKDKADYIPA